jgi:hypothetical protein
LAFNRHKSTAVRHRALQHLDDEALLSLKFRDLHLSSRAGLAAAHMRKLGSELAARGLKFRPHCWFAEEWFSPDGVPGIALPFYLAQPRLRRLERRFMHQVEGGNSKWLMRILRHEAGHALDTAYALRERPDWRAVFGNGSEHYPSEYAARPASHRYVLHLGHWYAQSHPTEDFAETFAVWLQPRAQWRRNYADWPALRKLEFVDQLMAEIGSRRAIRNSHREVEPISNSAMTLREHYRRKARRYLVEDGRYDRRLCRLFAASGSQRHAPAATFVREISPGVRRTLVRAEHLHPYVVQHAIGLLMSRCSDLHLRLRHDRRRARRDFLHLVRRVVKEILRRNRETYAL